MADSKKRDSNRSYYERNKERILERARLRAHGQPLQLNSQEEKIVTLYEPSRRPVAKSTPPRTPRVPKARPVGIHCSVYFISGLIILMSGFLFVETSRSFFSADQSWISACAKAAILEGAAIAFTLMQWPSFFGALFNRFMIGVVYLLGISVIALPLITGGQIQAQRVTSTQRTIRELETEISKKTALRDRYSIEDRVTLSRKYDLALSDLSTKLSDLRVRATEIPQPMLISGSLLSAILFRLVVMICNLVCIVYARRQLHKT